MIEIRGTRSQIAEQVLWHAGAPFSFKDREYLIPVYDTDRPVVLKAGRQTEKSTTLANIMIIDAITHPFFNNLYVSYTQKQVSFFSNIRFQQIINFSPLIRKYYYAGDILHRVTDKTFSNGSGFFLRSMYHSAESIRGLSVDRICFDETQSLDPEGMMIVEECLTRSKFRFRLYAGTAKSSANELERLWALSTQVEYLIKCEACSRWNYQDEKIIGLNGYICKYCGKPIDMRNGALFALGDKDADYFGIRITQMMVPWMPFEEIKRKYERMPLWMFYNEVLALPFDYAERPITLDELIACCEDRNFTPHYVGYEAIPTVAGIDWGAGGHSFTEIVVGHIKHNKYYIDFAHQLKTGDAATQIEILSQLVHRFNIKYIICDYGFGFGMTAMLREATLGRCVVVPCLYTQERQQMRWVEKEMMYHVNRTWLLSEVFRAIKARRFSFPRYSLMAPFFEEILNVSSEIHRIGGEEILVYVHNRDHPDDFLHALAYFKLAADTSATFLAQ